MPAYITYCSFALPERSLGVVILPGRHDEIEAALKCHALKINPGGELIVAVTSEEEIGAEQFNVLWRHRLRLIAPDEARRLFGAKSIKEWDDAKKAEEAK